MIQATWVSLNKKEYDDALVIQNKKAESLLEDKSNEQTIYAVEHPPTITIGRSGTREHIIASEDELNRIGMKIYEVDRGGDITYHGPGQLVVYPVLHLKPWDNDVRKYVYMLEEVVIRSLREAGIRAERAEGLPGVWIGNKKICAIGARARRRRSREFVTSHGIALNVNTNLEHFSTIIPCGLSNKGVTSISQALSTEVTLPEWEQRLRFMFSEIFQMSFA